MLSKFLELFAPAPNPSSQELVDRRRRRLNTRHWRGRKEPLAAQQSLVPISPAVVAELPHTALAPTSSSQSATDSAVTEAVQRVWAENRTLRKKVFDLQAELMKYKSCTADELARFKREIELLGKRLEQTHSGQQAKRSREDEKENLPERINSINPFRKVKKLRKGGSTLPKQEKTQERSLPGECAKKLKSSAAVTTTCVVPLSCVPPPPAPPPPVVVITEAGQAPDIAAIGEARKNLKRRAPMTDEDKPPARPQSANLPVTLTLNDVLQVRKTLKPATLRPKPVQQPVVSQEGDLKAALLKKFENVNVYSPFPTMLDHNDSFAEPPSPYRAF